MATQMLDSMVSSPTPTRAEVSDVATAIYDGADAVMLSAESATGRYPLETVTMMDRIIQSTEQHKLYRSMIASSAPLEEDSVPHAVAGAAASLAETIGAVAIVGFTSRGATAARIARKRTGLPILVLTPDLAVARRLNLLWGAFTVRSPDVHSYEEMVENAARTLQQEGLAKTGELAVVVAGIPFGHSGSTNNIRVISVN